MGQESIVQDGVVLFSLLEYIGVEGKNSAVFRARDHLMDCDMVIKRIVIEVSDDPELKLNSIHDVLREAQHLALCNHGNIADIRYASIKEENNYFILYIAMPLYKNGSLSKVLETRDLTVREIMKYAFEFLSGVSYIHSKGLVHGDIKPNNILISDNGEAVVTDFGLTFTLDESGWGVLVGAYMPHLPPELIDSKGFEELRSIPVNNQLDIYQVGMTLYRMCIGSAAYTDIMNELELLPRTEVIAIYKEGLYKKKPFPLHIPSRLQNIIKRCLAKKLEERYGSVREILNDLSAIKSSNILDVQYNSEEKEYVLHKANNTYTVTEIEKEYILKKTTAKTAPKPKIVKSKREATSYLENLK